MTVAVQGPSTSLDLSLCERPSFAQDDRVKRLQKEKPAALRTTAKRKLTENLLQLRMT
jgi:hypothetical protein